MIDLHPAMSVHARITDVRTRAHERGRQLRPELPQPRQREDLHRARGVRRRPASRPVGAHRRAARAGSAATRWATSAWTSACSRWTCGRTRSRRRLDPHDWRRRCCWWDSEGDAVITLDDMANTLGTIQLRAGHAASACACRACTCRRGLAAMTKPHIPLDEIRAQVEGCRQLPLGRRPHADGVRRGQSRGPGAHRRRGSGQERGFAGRAFRGRRRQVPQRASGHRRAVREDVLHRQCAEVPPPSNRDPRPEEIQACTPFLREQTRTIDPEYIVTLGNFSTKFILKTDMGITRLHGTLQRGGALQGVPHLPPGGRALRQQEARGLGKRLRHLRRAAARRGLRRPKIA